MLKIWVASSPLTVSAPAPGPVIVSPPASVIGSALPTVIVPVTPLWKLIVSAEPSALAWVSA